MRESEALRWLQLTYKVPSEPSQKRVWVWRRLQSLGAYALQNSVYLLPFSDEVERHFRQLAHDIHEMGGEASIFSVIALDPHDEQRILQTLLETRNSEYNTIVNICGQWLARVAKLTEEQHCSEALKAELAEVLEKAHVLFRTAKRHDLLGLLTAARRAAAAEALAACEQILRVFHDKDHGKVRRLLELHAELIHPLLEGDAPGVTATLLGPVETSKQGGPHELHDDHVE